jgi:hypothetical protein
VNAELAGALSKGLKTLLFSLAAGIVAGAARAFRCMRIQVVIGMKKN